METNDAVAQIKERCASAGIGVEEKTFLGEPSLTVALPDGRGARPLRLWRETLTRFAEVPFEKYRLLEDYRAVCSYEDGVIEGYVERAAGGANLRTLLLIRLGYRRLYQTPEEIEKEEFVDPLFHVKKADGTSAKLGAPSKILRALVWPNNDQLSLRISGVSIDRHDQARRMFESVANSLFFQLDSLAKVPIVTSRVRSLRGNAAQPIDPDVLQFPDTEFDPEPMALYWYGRGATSLPLLQFLAYYQVLEFYFPMYSAVEARRRIRLIVGDPRFSAHNDRDIQRILLASGSPTSRGRLGERSELRSAINHCADPQEIREFVSSQSDFFSKKAKGLTDIVLKEEMSDGEILDRVADRIYDIRCKIVHTKDSEKVDEQGLLLPYSREADLLRMDIDLLEKMAHHSLVAASRPVQS